MHRVALVLLCAVISFTLQTTSTASPTTCKPLFNHQDDKVAQNNRCIQSEFQASNTPGSAMIEMNSNAQGACVYTTAIQCGNEDILMGDIAAIDFEISVPPGKCRPTEWMAVFMFPWCGLAGGCWDGGEREVDFVETKGPNGPGGFSSNWGERPKQVEWLKQSGALTADTGTSQHITFTSSQILSGHNSGTYQWDIRVCDASETKCDSSNQLWHAYRETGPIFFNTSMMIVIDNWGVNHPPKEGCTLEVRDMVITKH
ncbi:hypothetical protein [uncultured Microbulbifer sp.]|uniref:hypothetical protein n=1 Tax=uncultured Microbulbifer sp. TaxID=348147 RepID=UPI0026085A21|nr:hypothetical protein [uncultured Microbulbifer sp.]